MKELAARSRSTLLEQVHDAVIATDLEGTIQLWNSAAERVYGYIATEIIGQPVSRLYFPEDAPLLQSAVIGPLASRDWHEVVLRNRRKDGTEIFIDLRVSVVRNREGKPIGYAGCSNDITVRKRAEDALSSAYRGLEQRVEARTRELQAEVAERIRTAAELQTSREKLHHIMVNAPGILFSCLPDTFAVTFISPNVECTFGYSAAEFVSSPELWSSRIHEADRERVLAAAAQIAESGRFAQEYRFQHRDGSYRWVRDDSTLLRNPAGEPLEIIGYWQDITEARQIVEARRETERLELLAQQLIQAQESERRRLSRELHDDLNQQLAMLVLDLALLRGSLPPSRKVVRRHLSDLEKTVAGISEDVDRMARQLHPAALEQLGLAAALQSDCAALARRTGIDVTCRCGLLPSELSKDVELCLYRVAQECLTNLVRHARTSRASVALEGTAEGVRLTVEDAGVGFDPSALPRERLGLLNMTERVRLLRGTLTVDSEIGRGTRLEAWIPLTESAHVESARSAGG